MKFLSSLTLSVSHIHAENFEKRFSFDSIYLSHSLSLTCCFRLLISSSMTVSVCVCRLTLILLVQCLSLSHPNPCHAFQFEFHPYIQYTYICIYMCTLFTCCLSFTLPHLHTLFLFHVLNFCTSIEMARLFVQYLLVCSRTKTHSHRTQYTIQKYIQFLLTLCIIPAFVQHGEKTNSFWFLICSFAHTSHTHTHRTPPHSMRLPFSFLNNTLSEWESWHAK